MPRKLSTDPKKVRQRIRNTGKVLDRDLAMLYDKPIDQWDFEELCRGKPRNDRGKFTGPPLGALGPLVRGEIYKRLQVITRNEMSQYTGKALETIVQVMTDLDTNDLGNYLTPSSVRLDAAKYLLDQLIGKPKTHVELSGGFDVRHFLAEIMVNPDGEDAHPVIEGAVDEEGVGDDE